MKVKSIRPSGVADVYNMEVEDTHDFAVENGVIVHNCYDELRYVCMKNPIAPRPAPAPAVKPYDPLEPDAGQQQYSKYDWLRRF